MSNLSQFLGGKVKRTQTFNTSGTFTPSASLLASGGWVEVTAVGGGGGGAAGVMTTNGHFAGGGGGGAVVTQTLQLSGATGVQVGAGGSAGILNLNGQVGGNGGTTTMFDGSTGAVAAGGYGGATSIWYSPYILYNTTIGGKSGNNSGALLSAGGGAGGPADGSIGIQYAPFQYVSGGNSYNVAISNYYIYAMGGPGIGGYGGGGAGSGVTLTAAAQNAGGTQTTNTAGYSSTGTPPNAVPNTGGGGGGTYVNTTVFTGTSQGTTTLNAPTNASNTIIGVTSNANINVGQSILVDSEYMYVRALNGATGITVTRGSANIVYSTSAPPQTGYNTTAATHTSGATGTWVGMNSLLTIPYNVNDPFGGYGGYVGTQGGSDNTIGGPVSATNGFSSLAVAIAATDTTITVTNAYFANSQVIQLDAEQMLVTAGGGTTTLTVTRGYNGTTAATHTGAVVGITSMKMTLNTTVGGLTLAYTALTNNTFFWLGPELCQVTSGGGTANITFTRNINKLSVILSDVYGFATSNATYYGSLPDLMYYGGLNQQTYRHCIVPATGILPTSASVPTGSYLLGNYNTTYNQLYSAYPYNLRWAEPALVLSSTGSGPYYNTIQRGTGATGMNYNVSVNANNGTPLVTPFNFYAYAAAGGPALLGATQFYVNASTTNSGGAGGAGVCIVSWFE